MFLGGKNWTADTRGWTNVQWLRTLPVGQRETGAQSWDGTDLTGLPPKENDWQAAGIRLQGFSRKGWNTQTPASLLLGAIV